MRPVLVGFDSFGSAVDRPRGLERELTFRLTQLSSLAEPVCSTN